jgi:phosphate:Na+ symporter
MYDKGIRFSNSAKEELNVIMSAVQETVETSIKAFADNNLSLAARVDPLEEVIDDLKSSLKMQHIARLQRNECTIELGFIFSDLITVLERISDHCSNIAGCVIEMSHNSMDMHDYLYKAKHEPESKFLELYNEYSTKYTVAKNG